MRRLESAALGAGGVRAAPGDRAGVRRHAPARRLPLDVVKLDRSFLTALEQESASAIIKATQ